VLISLTAAALAVVASAAADPAVDKTLCKGGGFTRVVGVIIDDPDARIAFRNQGECVSFVNHGGLLIPIGL
jgi:hypothetical protein